jgi:hypothetical protein
MAARVNKVNCHRNSENGLLEPAQIMVEKIFAAKRGKCGAVMGVVDDATMDALDDALMFAVGLMGRFKQTVTVTCPLVRWVHWHY